MIEPALICAIRRRHCSASITERISIAASMERSRRAMRRPYRHKWELLRDHLGASNRNCALDWSIEAKPLGPGGAIRQAFKLFNLPSAFVLNADTLYP
jgi:NDP-sugar pyrophosphorylase family protein